MTLGRLASAGAVVCLAIPIYGQSPTFEVASIRWNTGPPAMSIGAELRNGTFKATNVTLRAILQAAYGLTESRVIGPDWLDEDRFDFSAKSPPGVADREMQPMLQALLKDRFQLGAHSEQGEMAVYDLLIAKGGVKMPIYPARDAPMPAHPRGVPMIMATGITMSRLADHLSFYAGRPVLDKTRLSERYNISLVFAPLPSQADSNVGDFPNVFVALQEQLGLKLQPDKADLEVIVIDHMERKPSEN
jgi:uncharacterized protein (TIGR03435 family)